MTPKMLDLLYESAWRHFESFERSSWRNRSEREAQRAAVRFAVDLGRTSGIAEAVAALRDFPSMVEIIESKL